MTQRQLVGEEVSEGATGLGQQEGAVLGAGLHLHDAECLEHPQGLADRRARGPELLGELPFCRQTIAGRQLAPREGALQLNQDLLEVPLLLDGAECLDQRPLLHR